MPKIEEEPQVKTYGVLDGFIKFWMDLLKYRDLGIICSQHMNIPGWCWHLHNEAKSADPNS